MVTLKNNKDLSRKICQQVRIFHSGKGSSTLENLSSIHGPFRFIKSTARVITTTGYTCWVVWQRNLYIYWGSGYSYWSCSFPVHAWKELHLHRLDGDLYWSVYGVVWNCRPHKMRWCSLSWLKHISPQRRQRFGARFRKTVNSLT